MGKNGKTVLIVVLCAALCLGYYYYLTQRTGRDEAKMTEADLIISKDLEKFYPKTAREVVAFYSRIIKCYYDQEYTEGQLGQITEQARVLMDEELQRQNPEEQYLEAVQADISDYGREGKTISNISIENSNEMEFKTIEGKKYAYVDVTYYVKGEDKSERSSQTYILRQDNSSRWKILGFYQ